MIGRRLNGFDCRGGGRNRGLGCRNDEPPAAATTDLTAFAAGRTRLVGGPFVSRALLVRGAPAFAGDLALLFGRHRCAPSTLFALSCIDATPPVFSSRQPSSACIPGAW